MLTIGKRTQRKPRAGRRHVGTDQLLCGTFEGPAAKQKGRRQRGGAKEAEWEGRGGVRHVPGYTCSLSNPVTLSFLVNMRICVRTSALTRTHTHTHLSVNKQTQKGDKRERCSLREGRGEAEQARE